MFRHRLAQNIKPTRDNRKGIECLGLARRHMKHLQAGIETLCYDFVRRLLVVFLETRTEALDNYAISFRLEHRRSSN